MAMSVGACGRLGFDGVGAASPDAVVAPGTFAGLCDFAGITTILDGNSTDDTTGTRAASAIGPQCGTSPVVAMVGQGDPGVLDPSTHEPLLPPTQLGVMGGGGLQQLGFRYLQAADAPLTFGGASGRLAVTERATGRLIVDDQPVDLQHDFAAIMVVRDASSGTYYLTLHGSLENGTGAAGLWFSTVLAIGQDAHHWYIVEWTDVDANGPSASDPFAIVGSG